MPPNPFEGSAERRILDRRAFLALGVGALAWACARGGNEAEPEASPTEPTDEAGPPAPSGAGAVSIIATAPQGLALGDTRQGFAILRGQKPIAPKDVKVRLSGAGGEPFEVEVDKQEVLLGPGGDDGHDHEHPPGTEVTNIFTFRHDFDRPGVWEMAVTFDGGSGSAAFQIAESSPSPVIGDKATPTKSPTTDDPEGVDPICTRDPVCSMHDVTIEDALAADKPAVFVFATPRFCTSRTCGPVVDFVEQAKEEYGDRASFVHIEVWKNDKDAIGKPGGEAPAFAEWKLQTEPWIYFVDAAGVVKERWMGAVGSAELTKAVDALIEG